MEDQLSEVDKKPVNAPNINEPFLAEIKKSFHKTAIH
ncbi:MAG: hypothetical protein Ct9H300mP29_1490 [Candidatus Neomarinimicrobiota bacterium]|nr:MAG: hypothetical protein Ct9H300mP29_1490 [Candidatus Neomarinimicrobiota bacterium]